MDNTLLLASTLLTTLGRIPNSVIFITIAIMFLLAAGIVTLSKKLNSSETLKYEFITIIAHKFRTPLTQVKWSTEELVKNEPDPYKKQSIQDILDSNERLIRLTNTLVELTDTDTGSASSYKMVRTPVCAWVRKASEAAKHSFQEKNISFSVMCPPEEVFAKVDTGRMDFVLQTLLENACSYSSPGNTVEMTVSKSRNHIDITVTDHGIGIHKDDLPHIFTKFFRTEKAKIADTEGFGIGLYLAQTIVRRHRGKLSVFSEGEDMGTTFTMTLKAVR